MLTVNDIMTVAPRTVTPDVTLPVAARMMAEEGCRHLPVVDADSGRLIGIITDRDIRSARHTPFFDQASVEGCMTRDPITTTPETKAVVAAELLVLYKFGALPVVDNRQIVGIVTVSDFLNHFGKPHAENEDPIKTVFWQQFAQHEQE